MGYYGFKVFSENKCLDQIYFDLKINIDICITYAMLLVFFFFYDKILRRDAPLRGAPVSSNFTLWIFCTKPFLRTIYTEALSNMAVHIFGLNFESHFTSCYLSIYNNASWGKVFSISFNWLLCGYLTLIKKKDISFMESKAMYIFNLYPELICLWIMIVWLL